MLFANIRAFLRVFCRGLFLHRKFESARTRLSFIYRYASLNTTRSPMAPHPLAIPRYSTCVRTFRMFLLQSARNSCEFRCVRLIAKLEVQSHYWYSQVPRAITMFSRMLKPLIVCSYLFLFGFAWERGHMSRAQRTIFVRNVWISNAKKTSRNINWTTTFFSHSTFASCARKLYYFFYHAREKFDSNTSSLSLRSTRMFLTCILRRRRALLSITSTKYV